MRTLISGLAAAVCVCAQAPAPDWKTAGGAARAIQASVKNNVIKTAEKVPEDVFGFKPTPDVRSFGQVVGHLADANNTFCSAALGVPNPNPGIEKSKTSKEDLVAALKAAFELCDKAYDVNDAQAAEIVKFRGGERSRLSLLQFNSYHSNLHYGNLVTYARLKGIVPASSER